MTDKSRTAMSMTEAMTALSQGMKIRLPEWTGYLYYDEKKEKIMALTRTGDIVEADDDYTNVNRNDWEPVVEGMGFDWALLCLKAGKRVQRESWKFSWLEIVNDRLCYCRKGLMGERNVSSVWSAPETELMATDYVLFTEDVPVLPLDIPQT